MVVDQDEKLLRTRSPYYKWESSGLRKVIRACLLALNGCRRNSLDESLKLLIALVVSVFHLGSREEWRSISSLIPPENKSIVLGLQRVTKTMIVGLESTEKRGKLNGTRKNISGGFAPTQAGYWYRINIIFLRSLRLLE